MFLLKTIEIVFSLFYRKHTVTSRCHDGTQRWAVFKTVPAVWCIFASQWLVCLWFVNEDVCEHIWHLFVFSLILLFFSLDFSASVCVCLSTSRHLPQITTQIPAGKMLMHEWMVVFGVLSLFFFFCLALYYSDFPPQAYRRLYWTKDSDPANTHSLNSLFFLGNGFATSRGPFLHVNYADFQEYLRFWFWRVAIDCHDTIQSVPIQS